MLYFTLRVIRLYLKCVSPITANATGAAVPINMNRNELLCVSKILEASRRIEVRVVKLKNEVIRLFTIARWKGR